MLFPPEHSAGREPSIWRITIVLSRSIMGAIFPPLSLEQAKNVIRRRHRQLREPPRRRKLQRPQTGIIS
jgi:hypothetical protein